MINTALIDSWTYAQLVYVAFSLGLVLLTLYEDEVTGWLRARGFIR